MASLLLDRGADKEAKTNVSDRVRERALPSPLPLCMHWPAVCTFCCALGGRRFEGRRGAVSLASPLSHARLRGGV